MKRELWNAGWKFWSEKNAFALVWNIPEDAADVTLPHDAMLYEKPYAESKNGGNTGFRDGGVYDYVKILHLDEADREKTWILKFEGVYMNAMVYVNGALAAKCPYGYTGFYVPLNDYVNFGGETEVRVIVRNSGMTNSRWYSGSGIYRDVYLLSGDETYLVPDGVTVTTEQLASDAATLRVDTEIKNRSSRRRSVSVHTEILDADGKIVGENGAPVTMYEGESRRLMARMVINNPRAWSAGTPYLYQVRTFLYEGEELIDTQVDSIGIRTLSVDAVHGFRVNGETVKLRGACIHHDGGLLGAATYRDAEFRRVKLLKEAGFNAIRMSHHPAAPVLLDACDALGMYVMDETFDMWSRCKSDNDYALVFDEWWERDVEAMVRKDYNHPSVVLYSIGNEIPEIGTDYGAHICEHICERVRSLDVTRPTLASINGVFAAGDRVPEILADLAAELAAEGIVPEGNVNDFMTMMDAHMDRIVVHRAITERLDAACAYTDVAGYNYMTARYEPDGAERPNRVIVGSETYPPEIARNWALVEKLPYVIGDFTWTGWDYIGEAGVGIPAYQWGEGGFGVGFPCQLAYSGDIDVTGFRRPASYFREVVFGLRTEPYIAVQNPERYGQHLIKTPWVISDAISSWTYPGFEGKQVVVEVYAAGDEVELLCNGKSLGRKPAGAAVGCRVLFDTTYEPGTLVAVNYASGVEIGRTELVTASGSVSLVAEVEESVGTELAYITVSLKDATGNVVTSETAHLRVHCEGEAEVWCGSGDPKPAYNYTDGETDTWNGRAQIIARKPVGAGNATLQIESAKGSLTVVV